MNLSDQNITKVEGNAQNLKGNRIFYLPQSVNNPKAIFSNNGQIIQVKPTSIPAGAIVYKQNPNNHIQNLNPETIGTLSKVGINSQRNKTDSKTVFISNQPFSTPNSNTTFVYAIPTSNLSNNNNKQNSQGLTAKNNLIHAPIGSILVQSPNQVGIPSNLGNIRCQSSNLPNQINRSVIPYIINSNGQPTFLSLAQLNQINLAKQGKISDISESAQNVPNPNDPNSNKQFHPSCHSNACNNQNQIMCTCPSALHKMERCPEDFSVSSVDDFSDKPEKENEADENNDVPQSHVNYLMKLFQALRNSGVKSESFITAFKNLNIENESNYNNNDDGNIRQKLKESLVEVESMKEEIVSLKNHHKNIAQEFEKNMKLLNFKLMNKMRQVHTAARNKVMCPLLEPQIQQVRADRLRLDRITSEFNGKRMNTVGQLSDLEGVLEEVVDEMLKGRCALNSTFVNSLEQRLFHATNLILLCNERLPSLVQMQSRQVEIESSANDYEKQSMDRQMKQLEELKEKCKKLNETINTFKKLVDMQNSGGLSERKERRLNNVKAYLMNRKDSKFDRSKLLNRIDLIQPDSEDRMRKIELQEALLKRRKRVLLDVPNLSSFDLNRTKGFLQSASKVQISNSNLNSPDAEGSLSSSSSEDETTKDDDDGSKSIENSFLKAALSASLKSPIYPILRHFQSNQTKSLSNNKTNRVMFATKVHCNLKGLDMKLNCLGENDEYSNFDKIPTTDFREGGGC